MKDNAITYLLRLALVILLFRVTGAAGLGRFGLFISLAAVLTAICSLGLDGSFRKFAGKSEIIRSALAGNVLVISLVGVGIVCLVLPLFFQRLGEYHVLEYGSSMWGMIAVVIVPSVLLSVNRGFLEGVGAVRFAHYLAVAGSAALASLVVWYSLAGLLTAETAMAFYVLVTTVSGVALFLVIIHKSAWRLRIDFRLMFRTISGGFSRYARNFANVCLNYMDIIILAFILTSGEVGLYILVRTIVQLIMYAVSIYVKIPLTGDLTAFRPDNILPRHVRIAFSVSAVTGGAIMLTSWILLKWLIGPGFRETYLALLLLLPGTVLFAQSSLAAAGMPGRRIKTMTVINAFTGVVVLFFLCMFFIPVYGITGAALSFTTANIFIGIVNLFIYQRVTKIEFSDLFIIHTGELRYRFSDRARAG